MEETYTPAKWLRYLFYIHIASIVVSWIKADWNIWVSAALTVGTALCLYKLAPMGARYKKAAVYTAVVIGMSLPALFLDAAAIMTLAASIFSILAAYQEYNGHSELVARKDTKLSGNWHSLFTWEIVVGVISALLATTAAVILVLGEVATAAITGIVTLLLNGVSLVLGILYLVYMNRTIKLAEAQEV